MGWQISTHSIERVRSYAQAKDVFEHAAVFEKSSPLIRALKSKRMKHKSIVFCPVTQHYECRLYRTALVSYFPDGSTKVVLHSSVSSRSFIDVVFPYSTGATTFHHQSETWLRTKHGDHYKGTVYLTSAGEVIQADGDQGYLVVSDRRRMRETQKQLASYIKWETIIRRMTSDESDARAWAKRYFPTNELLEFARLALRPDLQDRWPDVLAAQLEETELRRHAYWVTGAKVSKPRIPSDPLPTKEERPNIFPSEEKP